MITCYCHNCWKEVDRNESACDVCGAVVPEEGWLEALPRGKELQGGKYRIIAPIGSGGFGRVFAALQYSGDINLGPVAIKMPMLPPGAGEHSRERLQEFMSEAAALRSINHPNIVTLHDAFIEEGVPYLVMERVTGSELMGSYLHGFERDLSFFFTIFIQIANALDELHTKGVVHCDLKPSNIGLQGFMGGFENFVKILDFGIAARWDGRKRLTVRGAGTLGFSAPEQLEGSPTPRSDVFSFGVLMYLALTGDMPYVWQGEYRKPGKGRVYDALPASVPEELKLLIGQCLELDETKRYPRMPTAVLRRIAIANDIPLDYSRDVLADPNERQKSILAEAKELFAKAGQSGLNPWSSERTRLYKRAAMRFDEAARLGEIPAAMEKFARKAVRFSGDKTVVLVNIQHEAPGMEKANSAMMTGASGIKHVLREAKRLYAEAGAEPDPETKRRIYGEAASLFDKAETLGGISAAMRKFGQKAHRYAAGEAERIASPHAKVSIWKRWARLGRGE